MTEERYCQSCAMPLKEGDFGTNQDGGENEDYCKYCYQNGAFTSNQTMEEMIDFCVPYMAAPGSGFTEESARALMQQTFPTLKRWKKD